MQTSTAGSGPAESFRGRIFGLESSARGVSRTRSCASVGLDATMPEYRGARLVRHQQKSWTGVTAHIAELRCEGALHVDLGSDSAMLSVVLDEVGGRMDIRSKACRDRSPSHQGPLSFIPPRLDAHGQATGICFLRHLTLRFDIQTLARMADHEIEPTRSWTPQLMFSDPGIMHLAQLFAQECASDEPTFPLYGDTLSIALLLALARLSTSGEPPVTRGRLAPWQLRRVTEYFAAHLADDIQLQTVSDLVKLSRSYFSRAFKISTGLAPHQWLVRARIEKAQQLLLETDHPIARIALEAGFADQAHLTRTFQRLTGQSPRAWQRARCVDDPSARNVDDVVAAPATVRA
jgi:AraC family transcriptional regulator